MSDNSNKYADIINLPHHVSTKHPPMDAIKRAAQFAPFAALTGHHDAIVEEGRFTDEACELAEDTIVELDRQLQELAHQLPAKPQINITYFQPDAQKAGGSYQTIKGTLTKIDNQQQILILDKEHNINFANIIHLNW